MIYAFVKTKAIKEIVSFRQFFAARIYMGRVGISLEAEAIFCFDIARTGFPCAGHGGFLPCDTGRQRQPRTNGFEV